MKDPAFSDQSSDSAIRVSDHGGRAVPPPLAEGAPVTVIRGCDDQCMSAAAGFDYRGRLDELRCRPTDWLVERRDALVREQRRLRVEELAVTAVLDESGALDDSVADRDGVSTQNSSVTGVTA